MRFDVMIVEARTQKAVSVIGTNLNEEQAGRRIETGISRINENYFVSEYPTGKYQEGDTVE